MKTEVIFLPLTLNLSPTIRDLKKKMSLHIGHLFVEKFLYSYSKKKKKITIFHEYICRFFHSVPGHLAHWLKISAEMSSFTGWMKNTCFIQYYKNMIVIVKEWKKKNSLRRIVEHYLTYRLKAHLIILVIAILDYKCHR